ncbi:hypothetical protein C8R43DRAFT_987139 [Mycena crocata]|nr:hypothetical protein C8R43DRAFT_987139 [Mycena crocata]
MSQDDESPQEEITTTYTRRRIVKRSYVETSSDDGPGPAGIFDEGQRVVPPSNSTDDDAPPRLLIRRSAMNNLDGFIASDKPQYDMRSRVKRKRLETSGTSSVPNSRCSGPSSRAQRHCARRAQLDDQEDGWSPGTQHTSSPDTHPDSDIDAERPYALRQRQKINYAIPPPLETTSPPRQPARPASSQEGTKGPGLSASGAELERWMGMGGNNYSDNPANADAHRHRRAGLDAHDDGHPPDTHTKTIDGVIPPLIASGPDINNSVEPPDPTTGSTPDPVLAFLNNVGGFDLTGWKDDFEVKGLSSLDVLRVIGKWDEQKLSRSLLKLFPGMSEIHRIALLDALVDMNP